MNMTYEAGLELAVLSVQLALISSYEDNCPINLLGQENVLRCGYVSCSASEGKLDKSLISAKQIKPHDTGNSIEWLSGDTERR